MSTRPLHEAVVALLRSRPSLVAELARRVGGVDLPEFDDAELVDTTLPQLDVTPLHPDAVVRLRRQGVPVAAVAAEMQRRPDERKVFDWPVQLAMLQRRERLPGVLAVFTLEESVARWARRVLGPDSPGYTPRSVVIGPDAIPWVTDPTEAARAPEVAVLSGLAHAAADDAGTLGAALPAALGVLDPGLARIYLDLIISAAAGGLRRQLEEQMFEGYEWQSETMKEVVRREEERVAMARAQALDEGLARGLDEGLARAKAEDVLAVLAARGFSVPDAVAARVRATTELAELDRLVRRAATVGAVAELF